MKKFLSALPALTIRGIVSFFVGGGLLYFIFCLLVAAATIPFS